MMKPFQAAVPETVLAGLRERLPRTRRADQLPGTGWTLGIDMAWLRPLCAVWVEIFI